MSGGGKTHRILIVEDEALVAMLIEDIALDLGHEIAAVAGRLDDALKKASTLDIGCAILDVNLNGDRSYPIADVLERRKIPFLFVTGYGAAGLEGRWKDAIVLQKPFEPHQLAEAITRACARQDT